MHTVHILPIGGTVSLSLLEYVAGALEENLNFPCRLMENALDIRDAFHPARQQYHSTHILSKMAEMKMEGNVKILGIADVDLFIPVLTFVFGEAQIGNRAALLSLRRLRQSFYGLPDDEPLLFTRCEKEALHELGHTFGLLHCENYECVMHFSNSIEHIDMKSNIFCDTCAPALSPFAKHAP